MPELEIGLIDGGKLNFNHFFLQFIENKKQNKTKKQKKDTSEGFFSTEL